MRPHQTGTADEPICGAYFSIGISKYIKLVAFGVVDAAHVDVRAGHGRGDVFHVEEEESGLRGVGLDGFGGESRGFDLVLLLAANGAFHLFVRDGKRQGGVVLAWGLVRRR